MKPQTMKVNEFSLNYDGESVVEIELIGCHATFDEKLSSAHSIQSSFRRNKPGSDWGCDGIGYMVEKKAGRVRIMRSGVGPKRFNEGVEALKQKGYNVQAL